MQSVYTTEVLCNLRLLVYAKILNIKYILRSKKISPMNINPLVLDTLADLCVLVT